MKKKETCYLCLLFEFICDGSFVELMEDVCQNIVYISTSTKQRACVSRTNVVTRPRTELEVLKGSTITFRIFLQTDLFLPHIDASLLVHVCVRACVSFVTFVFMRDG